jgi:hypothetical protein
MQDRQLMQGEHSRLSCNNGCHHAPRQIADTGIICTHKPNAQSVVQVWQCIWPSPQAQCSDNAAANDRQQCMYPKLFEEAVAVPNNSQSPHNHYPRHYPSVRARHTHNTQQDS